MWQRNKGKIIFVIIFTIIAIAATSVLTWYTLSQDNNEEKEIIDYSNIFKLSNEKTCDGIGKYDNYDENPLEIKNIEDKKGKVSISYVQISGLKDVELEKKINEEIKDFVYGYDQTKNPINSFAYLYANYANVLSISMGNCYELKNGDWEYENRDLNYNLINGEKIKFADLFVSETEALRILRESAYKSLAWTYWNDKNISDVDDGDWALDMKKIDYSEIEEKLSEIIFSFRNGELDNNFNFSNTSVSGTLTGKSFNFSMVDYMDSIAIYNRYKNANLEEIYINPKIGRKNLIALTYRQEEDYGIREENENYYIDMKIEKNSDIKYSDEVFKVLKNKIDQKAQEVRDTVKKDDKFHVIDFNIYLSKKENGNLGVENVINSYLCEKGDWSSIKDKLYKQWRDFDGASVNPADIVVIDEKDVISHEYENRFIEMDSKGKEVFLKKDEAKLIVEDMNLKFNTIEMGFTYDIENKKNKINNYYSLDNLFTDSGVEIYEENAKDYLKTETKKDDGYDWKEYYLVLQDKYQVGVPELFYKSNIEITEVTADTIKAKIESIFFKDDENQKAYYETNDENGNYFDKYNIEIELVRTGFSNWKINNYVIK